MVEGYPQKFFITSGVGNSDYQLVSFDQALRDASIADFNLVKISSILPMRCQRSASSELPPRGSAILTAYGTRSSNIKGQLIASAISAAIPDDPNEVGVIMEYADNCSAEEAEKKVREMAYEAMKNRNRAIKEIISSSVESICNGDGYITVVSAICLW